MGNEQEILGNRQDLTGKQFSRLTVVSFIRYDNKCKSTLWLCQCSCGKRTKTHANHLVSKHTKSCGCLQREAVKKQMTSHGETIGETTWKRSKEYQTWVSMRARCFTPMSIYYKNYGGRGITVCKQWMDFKNFLQDMGRAPSPDHSIERINNNGNYEPGNCRWATSEDQNNNKRSNKYFTFQNKQLTLARWSRELNIPYGTLYDRIHTQGLPLEQVFMAR